LYTSKRLAINKASRDRHKPVLHGSFGSDKTMEIAWKWFDDLAMANFYFGKAKTL